MRRDLFVNHVTKILDDARKACEATLLDVRGDDIKILARAAGRREMLVEIIEKLPAMLEDFDRNDTNAIPVEAEVILP